MTWGGKAAAVSEAMQALRVVRCRDGAVWWGLFKDPSTPDGYAETLIVASLAEHLRQRARTTAGDRVIEVRVRSLAAQAPEVTHLVARES